MRPLFWRLILLSPLLLLVVLFALSNTETVHVGLWPTDLLIQAPLSLVVLGAMGIAFLLGAACTWVVGLGARLRARRAEAEAGRLRAELAAAQARLSRAERAPLATILPPASTGLAQSGPARALAVRS
jgi:uncharacterized integral membrane protein